MAIHIEVRLIWLTLGFEKIGGLLGERSSYHVRASVYSDANIQIFIDYMVVIALRRRLYGERLYALTVENQLNIVRADESFDVLISIARQPDLPEQANSLDSRTPCPQWQVVELLLLRKVRRQIEGIAAYSAHRASQCEPTDFPRCRDVTFQQRRRQIRNGYVVKTVTCVVGRKQRRSIDI